jgi:hypothetical protein
MTGRQEGCVGVYSYNDLIGFLVVVIGNGGLVGSYGHQS